MVPALVAGCSVPLPPQHEFACARGGQCDAAVVAPRTDAVIADARLTVPAAGPGDADRAATQRLAAGARDAGPRADTGQPDAGIGSRLRAEPSTLDFGVVAVGRAPTRALVIRNGGGPVSIIALDGLAAGAAFRLDATPSLPARLEPGAQLNLNVSFEPRGAGVGRTTLTVRVDDGSSLAVPVTGVGQACNLACPVTNGVGMCVPTGCEVASCNDGWFDPDDRYDTGCECAELSPEPGAVCADAIWAGTFPDADPIRATMDGLLPFAGDWDLWRFFGQDNTQIVTEDYDVRVTLTSADLEIEMCVYQYQTNSHLALCHFDNEACGRAFRMDGQFGRNDSADYIIKVTRTSTGAPSCTPYTIEIQNG